MHVLRLFLVFVIVLFGCQPSQTKSVKNTDNAERETSIEPPLIAEFRGKDVTWIVSSNWDLLYTRDAGVKWNKINSDTVGGFYLLSFIDENNGWAISLSGKSGKLWRTENGGEIWESLVDDSVPNAPSFVSAVDFRFIDKLHGWILGPFQIWRTVDGGHTWQSHAPPTQEYYHFFSLFFLDSHEGWIGGHYGTVYHTEDGGEAWEEIEVGSKETEFSNIFFVSKSIGWVKGSREKLYRTLDGGRNWQHLSFSIPGEDWHIRSIYFLNRNEGWAVGWGPDSNVYENKGGIVMHTTNGGASWKEIDVKHNESIYEVAHFSDSQNGWILSRRNVYRTDDGGKTWRNVLQLPQSPTNNN